MNMQISSLAGSTAIPAPVTLPGADPIIDLIERYNAGKAAYEAMPAKELGSSDENDSACDRTWRPYFEVLDSRPPQILTIQGAIAAMHYVQDEAGDELDGYNVGAVVRRVSEFLESAAGLSLVHPDAELLGLGQQIDALTLKINANCEKHNRELLPECDRVYTAVPAVLIITQQDWAWFPSAVAGEHIGNKWNLNRAASLKAPKHGVATGTLEQAQARAAELRQAAVDHLAKYEKWEFDSGMRANEDEYCALAQERDRLSGLALAIRPVSLAGVAVQAKIVKNENPLLFRTDEESFDTGEKEIVDFVNNVMASARAVEA